MKKIQAVIGSNFGDEGKGLFTDFLTSQIDKDDSVVVRHNGGAQAGHTVVSNNIRHVFSHFGSGSFNEVPTYLSEFFVSNPIVFLKEAKELEKKGVNPKIYIDRKSIVTTPYDMIINQVVEKNRGNDRHGSVGIGFNETIERNTYAQFSIKIEDLFNIDKLRIKLNKIKDIYVKQRAKYLNIFDYINANYDFIFNDEFVDKFINDCQQFNQLINLSSIETLNSYENIVFEGAQGLLLDQNYGYFPHVTRSNTGIANILQIMSQLNLKDIEVVYATRAYLTRHGAGPLQNELAHKPYSKVEDLTNVPNDFQGTIRFAYLDLDLLFRTIELDLKNLQKINNNVNLDYRFGISCLDQIDSEIKYYLDRKLNSTSIEKFLNYFRNPYLSYGNNNKCICTLKK